MKNINNKIILSTVLFFGSFILWNIIGAYVLNDINFLNWNSENRLLVISLWIFTQIIHMSIWLD